jgi:predicted branched-subunit amino acid permease
MTFAEDGSHTLDWLTRRRAVTRDGIGVGLAVGSFGLSFGALSVTAGLSVLQTCALSVLAFTGGSQFAFIGVIGAGGAPVTAVTTAALLGSRNALYGLRLAPILGVAGPRRFLAAQLVIDESAAMSLAHEDPVDAPSSQPPERAARLAFWTTGLAVFVCWNLATLIGALLGNALSDPSVFGLDAAAPAAFLALLWPRLKTRGMWGLAALSAVVALVVVPAVPAGIPVLCAGVVAVVAALLPRRADTDPTLHAAAP